MFDILCVTNRKLCKEDFLCHLEKIIDEKPAGLILREKDLSPREYQALAKQVRSLCFKSGVPCILHSFLEAAKELNHRAIHLPMYVLRSLSSEDRGFFEVLGASCHSVEEAREAESLGCTYVTAGHIFATACKEGFPGRGIGFLRQVCQEVSIPVYAIGGIDETKLGEIRETGAAGACLMSSLMTVENLSEYMSVLRENVNEIPLGRLL